MNLIVETFIVSITILVSSAIPFFWNKPRKKNSLMFLIGTGALTGIVVFDLLPDLWSLGGVKSLWILVVVWVIYSLMHVFHIGHHEHLETHPEKHLLPEDTSVDHVKESSIFFILISMMAHCFASGILLAISYEISTGLAKNVFYALLAHKIYEGLTVSSVIVEKVKSRLRAGLYLLAYSLSLPFGVVLSLLFKQQLTPQIALVATSFAAGTLLGCLVFDFWVPTVVHLKHAKKDLGWIVLGLLATQAFMFLL